MSGKGGGWWIFARYLYIAAVCHPKLKFEAVVNVPVLQLLIIKHYHLGPSERFRQRLCQGGPSEGVQAGPRRCPALSVRSVCGGLYWARLPGHSPWDVFKWRFTRKFSIGTKRRRDFTAPVENCISKCIDTDYQLVKSHEQKNQNSTIRQTRRRDFRPAEIWCFKMSDKTISKLNPKNL